MAKSYFEKLKDPRWQKKRLEILQRDDFACVVCDARNKTLHVHHGYYERGSEPWEYPEQSLHTLCEDCHFFVQDSLRDVHWEISQLSPSLLDPLKALLSCIRQVNDPCVAPSKEIDDQLVGWISCLSALPLKIDRK